ncbi:uncharacterized protein H6S33_007306 [Morchella sextelata]|uniref:uncharacterized protein n=1 Tax=Morchella sextelata TaxID=1174677 RepID=UPI001D044345|nr:uncharacterized protein H6S33_007306 [Morchella sextelata]KAH0603647.1 hypothetical protein H6S33_007306 [Morchella sextelata]
MTSTSLTPESTAVPNSTTTRPPPSTTSRKKALTKSHFLSGGASGILSAVLLQPADLLKTRIQQAPPSGSATATLIATVRTIIRSDTPIRSLWRGTVPSALRTGVGSAIYFSALNTVRTSVAKSRLLPGDANALKTGSSALPVLSPLGNLLTGAGTRAAVGYVVMPITIIKVRYESSMYKYTSMLQAVKDILRVEGFRGFFSGWGATAIRDAPYAGLYILFYEQSKKSLSILYSTGRKMDNSVAAMINTVSGAGAGALATAITNPFDALKTRIQVDPGRYRNLWQAAKLVVTEESGRMRGRALFDGLGLRIARKAVSSAVVWTIYEGLVR